MDMDSVHIFTLQRLLHGCGKPNATESTDRLLTAPIQKVQSREDLQMRTFFRRPTRFAFDLVPGVLQASLHLQDCLSLLVVSSAFRRLVPDRLRAETPGKIPLNDTRAPCKSIL